MESVSPRSSDSDSEESESLIVADELIARGIGSVAGFSDEIC